jgi:hypothetical protein
MSKIRDIVKEVFAVVSELRTAAVGPLPTTGGAAEVAAMLDAKPLTLDGGKPGSVSTSEERALIAKRLFDQWRAAAVPAQATLTIQIKDGERSDAPCGSRRQIHSLSPSSTRAAVRSPTCPSSSS